MGGDIGEVASTDMPSIAGNRAGAERRGGVSGGSTIAQRRAIISRPSESREIFAQAAGEMRSLNRLPRPIEIISM